MRRHAPHDRRTPHGSHAQRDHRLSRGRLDPIGLATNVWAKGEAAASLNLEGHPEARVDLRDGPRLVAAHAAEGEERDRLWARWGDVDEKLDAYAARRSIPTTVVVLEPRRAPRTP